MNTVPSLIAIVRIALLVAVGSLLARPLSAQTDAGGVDHDATALRIDRLTVPLEPAALDTTRDPAPTTAEPTTAPPTIAAHTPEAPSGQNAQDAQSAESAPSAIVAARDAGASSAAGEERPSTDTSRESVVRLHDRNVFLIRRAAGTLSAAARARAASQALERLVEEKELPELRYEDQGEVAIVFGGSTPIVQLRADDAAAAGDASLAIHAASVTSRVRDALRTERQRKSLAESVFSFSLLVFSGLIAVLLLRKVKELADKLRAFIEDNPDRLPALRVQSIDLMRPAAFRGALSVSLGIGRLLSQLGIAYGWLLFASSLFAATRTYTERLTGFVLTPISALIGRVGTALPLLVIGLFALTATVLLVRFVGLFFGSVARGETTIGWLPSDLAAPTGTLVRLGIVIAALLLAAPLVTGNDDGALARVGIAALVALGFASSPVLASAAVGIPAVYGRRVRIGDYAEIGGRAGRVLAITLLEVRLEDEMSCQVRVPHLATLLHPTRLLGASAVSAIDVVLDPQAPQAHVRAVLMGVARRFGTICRVDLVRLDREGAHYHIATRGPSSMLDADLATSIADAIAREQIALGLGPAERT